MEKLIHIDRIEKIRDELVTMIQFHNLGGSSPSKPRRAKLIVCSGSEPYAILNPLYVRTTLLAPMGIVGVNDVHNKAAPVDNPGLFNTTGSIRRRKAPRHEHPHDRATGKFTQKEVEVDPTDLFRDVKLSASAIVKLANI